MSPLPLLQDTDAAVNHAVRICPPHKVMLHESETWGQFTHCWLLRHLLHRIQQVMNIHHIPVNGWTDECPVTSFLTGKKKKANPLPVIKYLILNCEVALIFIVAAFLPCSPSGSGKTHHPPSGREDLPVMCLGIPLRASFSVPNQNIWPAGPSLAI